MCVGNESRVAHSNCSCELNGLRWCVRATPFYLPHKRTHERWNEKTIVCIKGIDNSTMCWDVTESFPYTWLMNKFFIVAERWKYWIIFSSTTNRADVIRNCFVWQNSTMANGHTSNDVQFHSNANIYIRFDFSRIANYEYFRFPGQMSVAIGIIFHALEAFYLVRWDHLIWLEKTFKFIAKFAAAYFCDRMQFFIEIELAYLIVCTRRAKTHHFRWTNQTKHPLNVRITKRKKRNWIETTSCFTYSLFVVFAV